MPHLLVMAKSPVPGAVKTRLCPPCTPFEAARLAGAALNDTLDAAQGTIGFDRLLLALDGDPGDVIRTRPRFSCYPQIGETFAERLTDAWARAGTPGVQIGMDTPQVTPFLLDQALSVLMQPGVDAVLGPASDGGWWAIGMKNPIGGVFEGIGMSTSRTGIDQVERLEGLGMRVALLPELRDFDHADDAVEIARQMPASRFGRAVSATPCLSTSLNVVNT